jgi:hypothetical protein
MSDRKWYGANAAYTKLTKTYTTIDSASFYIATVLDPRNQLVVYDTTQHAVAMKKKC